MGRRIAYILAAFLILLVAGYFIYTAGQVGPFEFGAETVGEAV